MMNRIYLLKGPHRGSVGEIGASHGICWPAVLIVAGVAIMIVPPMQIVCW